MDIAIARVPNPQDLAHILGNQLKTIPTFLKSSVDGNDFGHAATNEESADQPETERRDQDETHSLDALDARPPVAAESMFDEPIRTKNVDEPGYGVRRGDTQRCPTCRTELQFPGRALILAGAYLKVSMIGSGCL